MAFVEDTFTDTNGTELSAHNSDFSQVGSGDEAEIQSNALIPSSSVGFEAYINDGGTAPDDADYDVQADIYIPASDDVSLLVGGRMEADGDGYYAFWQGGDPGWRLLLVAGGAPDSYLGSAYNGDTPTTAKTVMLRMRGTTISVLIDDVERISETDATYSAAGRPGIGLWSSDVDTTMDNWEAENAPASVTVEPPSVSITVAGQVPVIGTSIILTPASVSITVSSSAPTIALGPWSAIPAAGSVTASSSGPTIGNTVQTSTINTTSSVAVGAGVDFRIAPDAGAITATGQVPVLAMYIAVAAGSVTVSSSAPTVSTVTDVIIQPLEGSVTVATQAPLVVTTGDVVVSPNSVSVTVTGQAPTIDEWSGFTGAPASTSLTVAGQLPIIGIGPLTVTPASVSITATGYAPTSAVTTGLTLQPGWGIVLIAGTVPVLSITSYDVTVEPDATTITITTSVPLTVIGGLAAVEAWTVKGSPRTLSVVGVVRVLQVETIV